MLAKTRDLVATVTADLEAFDIAVAARAARLRRRADQLVRAHAARPVLGRGRTDAFDTLYTVLETLTRVAAPLIPLVTEEVWHGLTGGRSVHLADWPTWPRSPLAEFRADDALVAAMDQVRAVASLALALRKAHGLRVRLPLARAHGRGRRRRRARAASATSSRDELNVKSVDFVDLGVGAAEEFGITQRLTVNARAAGRARRGVQASSRPRRPGLRTGDDGSSSSDGRRRRPAAGQRVRAGDSCSPRRVTTRATPRRRRRCRPASAGSSCSTSSSTTRCWAEGSPATSCARSRTPARPPASTSATASTCPLDVPGECAAAVGEHRDLIARETLAVSVTIARRRPPTRRPSA